MKLAKIKKAFGKYLSLWIVTDEDGTQWIGNGNCYYVADKSLDLTEDNLLAVLDIDETKRDEIKVLEMTAEKMPWFSMFPQEGNDEALRPVVCVSWQGEMITCMLTETGEAAMVKTAQLAPAEDNGPAAFFLRATVHPETGEMGNPCVACFSDMLCCALIAPMKAEAAEEIWERMRDASAPGLQYCVGPDAENVGEEK